MPRSDVEVLRDQGRGVAGALLVVGVAFLYTMETWWLAWELPMRYLLAYAFVGLGVVLAATRHVGFRSAEEDRETWNPRRVAADFSELLLQSFVTAFLVLLLLGVVRPSDGAPVFVRLGLINVVPLGLGAALANAVLRESEDGTEETEFPGNVAAFSLGALFVAFPVAPTEEMERLASYMGWERGVGLVLASLAVAYLVLYELGFRGQRGRVEGRSRRRQLGTTFVVYAVALTVSTTLLVAFGHASGTTVSELVQQTIVLSFLASVGASAGEVVL